MGTRSEAPYLSYENDSIASAFVHHWASGTNYATGKVGSPVGWLGASAYFSEFAGNGAQFSPAGVSEAMSEYSLHVSMSKQTDMDTVLQYV